MRRAYHYRGISAPTVGGTPETFDLGMSLFPDAGNVKLQGPGMAKKPWGRRRFEYGNRGQYDS